MLIDFIIVATYFAVVMLIAMSGKRSKDMGTEEYFLSSRNLNWYSIAISTIATNIHGYQFLGMMGSAYLYGIAQANFEINAIQGLWMAAFIFVPLYLKDRIITITQFLKKRLGEAVGLAYSIGNLILFSTIGLGVAMLWGAYVGELAFSEFLSFISEDRMTRVGVLIVFLGVFSAIYTYFGGLQAVVRTDIIQFSILLLGGTIILWVSLQKLGGWGQLYEKTPELMNMHLPADHPKLGWLGMFGLLFLNINYWCANQSVIQRSLAAKSLRHAQVGLMAGGIMKYYVALIVIVPGVALAGIVGKEELAAEPDQAFTYILANFLSPGFRGVILCAVFASLMSTIDSLFNSLATLFSIDIYKEYINKNATEQQVVAVGRRTILVTLVIGILMAFFLTDLKFANQNSAFTHTLNELRYYFNHGFVVVICTAAFLMMPNKKLALFAFLLTVPINYALKTFVPDLPYLVRALVVITSCLALVSLPTILKNGFLPVKEFYKSADPRVTRYGLILVISMVAIHIILAILYQMAI